MSHGHTPRRTGVPIRARPPPAAEAATQTATAVWFAGSARQYLAPFISLDRSFEPGCRLSTVDC